MYVPEVGDLVWLKTEANAGPVQARRLALVLSPRIYNEPSGLAIVCAVSTEVKGYPFEVWLGRASRVAGVVLADHVSTIDWRAHSAEFIERVGTEVLDRVQEHLPALLGL